MKRKFFKPITISTCIMLCISFFNVNPVLAQQDVSIKFIINEPIAYVNEIETKIDKNEKVVPFIANDRTMVPLRFVAEAIELKVEWLENERTAILTNTALDSKIRFTIDSNLAEVNGDFVELDSSVTLINDRVFVPVRFMAEHFSCGVEWNALSQEVIIKQEREVDVKEREVQKLFQATLDGGAFASYYINYLDADIMDDTNNLFGGLMREIISFLSMKEFPNKEYTDEEADEFIKSFLSEGDIVDDTGRFDLGNLKTDIESGETFGNTATRQKLVAIYKKNELDEYSKALFGRSLPESPSKAYSIAYASFFFCSRINIIERLPAAVGFIVYYNETSEEFLLTKDLSILTENSAKDKSTFKHDTKLLKATRHNDEISLYTYHEGEFNKYSGGKASYKGNYKNTYKKNENGFYWISSYGNDE